MNRHQRIAVSLACATATLLGVADESLAQQQRPADSAPVDNASGDKYRIDRREADPAGDAQALTDGWTFDSALLLYVEPDRVSAVEPVISATRRTAAGSVFSAKLVVDVLTGASANGAVATDRPQTFTHPSGNGRYTEPANEVPLDNIFQDTRVAVSADWEAAISRTLRYGVGGNFSTEYDYRSLSASGRLIKDFNQKNTTLTLALSQAQDSIEPVGGVPEARGRMDAANYATRADSDDKSVTDLLVGLTQIVDQRSFIQLNYGLTSSSGYHNDPYKLVSLVDDEGRPFDTSATVPSVIYENRPDKRTRHAVFTRYKRLLGGGDMLDLSYRLTTDDWGIVSNTLDTKYRWALSSDRYIQARVRYYTQSAADFYRPYLRQSESVPTNVSSDYRVGDMDAWTLGVEYGWGHRERPWRVSLEYYLQQPKEPGGKFGVLQNQELAPAVSAIMLRINKSF